MADLRANFEGECSEVGMYLAMARVAHREGYPENRSYTGRKPLMKKLNMQRKFCRTSSDEVVHRQHEEESGDESGR